MCMCSQSIKVIVRFNVYFLKLRSYANYSPYYCYIIFPCVIPYLLRKANTFDLRDLFTKTLGIKGNKTKTMLSKGYTLTDANRKGLCN